MEAFEFSCVRVIFGINSIERLPEELERLNARKVLVVTDKALRSLGERVCGLQNFDCELWSDVEPEPEISVVEEILEDVRFDTVVGVGGGSTLDVAKLAAVTGKGSIPNLLSGKIPKREKGLILCPTTAGTGSEVTKLAVFKVPGKKVRQVFDSDQLYADTAIVDPKLTITAPPEVTASSGLDAICHAIEAYTSLLSNPVSDILAERAIKVGAKAIRKAYANGKNLKARVEMSYASLLAGVAFNAAGTSLAHALGYAHSHLHGSSHGKSVAVTMPYVLQYNAIADFEKHARISRLLGEVGRSLRDSAFKAGVAFHRLLKDLNMPTNLAELGVDESKAEEIVERIFLSEKHVSRNPRLVRREEMTDLVKKSIHGILTSEDE